MSIYDGLCDVGSAINDRCPNPATRFRNEMAWCEKDGQGYTPLGNRSWAEIAAQFDAARKRTLAVIEEAESEKAFIVYDGELCTPREVRAILRNGYTVESCTLERDPLSWAESYERDADDAAQEAKENRAKARRIRKLISKCTQNTGTATQSMGD